ncbi:RtcB family protein [Bosea sp. LjRoot237]|uniref:RtcB family protein n=1 Tax=Bosea sp. LjRoot237 TaxID=3342292 RepID=UPI003ECED7E1
MTKHITYGQHDANTLEQMDRCMEHDDAVMGVLCADGHMGYNHPIGGVIGYREHISISGVGFDIACGNMAVQLDIPAAAIKPRIADILAQINSVISFGVGRVNDERVEHAIFDNDELWRAADATDLRAKAKAQLGTVGSGNHYVDIFSDESGSTWIGVHFGSRGLGHTITTRALKEAGAKDTMNDPPALVLAQTDAGRRYMAGIDLGGLYAYAGREWVVERVRRIVGGMVLQTVHNHHNFLWREYHWTGEPLYVVRKGATPAFPGQLGFVGGSMGDRAVILEGVDNAESRHAMHSTVHGAGRVMSRTAARGRFVKDENGKKQRQPGLVRHDEWQAWLEREDVTVVGGDLDEAPQAYRRLPDVLAAHANTIAIKHVLKPVGVVMAGASVVDPYKD